MQSPCVLTTHYFGGLFLSIEFYFNVSVFFANLFIENFSFYLSKKNTTNFTKCCLTFNTNGFCPYLLQMAVTKINLQFTDKIRILWALCYTGRVFPHPKSPRILNKIVSEHFKNSIRMKLQFFYLSLMTFFHSVSKYVFLLLIECFHRFFYRLNC